MFDTENEILNLFALARSIRANTEKIGRQISGEGAENTANLIEGIERMCDIIENKLSIVQKEVTEKSEVKKDV